MYHVSGFHECFLGDFCLQTTNCELKKLTSCRVTLRCVLFGATCRVDVILNVSFLIQSFKSLV